MSSLTGMLTCKFQSRDLAVQWLSICSWKHDHVRRPHVGHAVGVSKWSCFKLKQMTTRSSHCESLRHYTPNSTPLLCMFTISISKKFDDALFRRPDWQCITLYVSCLSCRWNEYRYSTMLLLFVRQESGITYGTSTDVLILSKTCHTQEQTKWRT